LKIYTCRLKRMRLCRISCAAMYTYACICAAALRAAGVRGPVGGRALVVYSIDHRRAILPC
jgi:hypothetical protein